MLAKWKSLRDGTEQEDCTSQKQTTSPWHTFDWELQANYAADSFVRMGLLAPERLRELSRTNSM